MLTAAECRTTRRHRQRLNKILTSSLVTRIVSGQYREGERLPTESELGDEFDVSRTVVREAAKVLEDKGLVSIRQGQGCTVLASSNWRIMDPDIIVAQLEHDADGRVFEDFIFVREALECEMAAKAAEGVTPEVEQRGRDLIDLAAAHTTDPDVFLEYDYSFHELLMEASGSTLGLGLMQTLKGPLHATRRLTNRIPGTIEHGQQAHEKIFREIVARNPIGARREMRKHLEWLKVQRMRSGLVGRANAPAMVRTTLPRNQRENAIGASTDLLKVHPAIEAVSSLEGA